MRWFILGISVLCLAITARGDPTEYDLSDYCGSSLSVYSSAILKVNEWWPDGDCTVKIYSNFHNQGDDKLRVDVLSMDVNCGVTSLQLFDGDVNPRSELSTQLCGFGTDTIQTDYISVSEAFVTVKLQSAYKSFSSSVKLLVTATAVSYESTDFICTNNYDVRNYLQCDGYNNCGDWSDEYSYQCNPDDVISWSLEASVIAGLGVLCVVVAIIVIALIVKGRRQRRLNGRLLSAQPGYPQGPPAYGTIQTGVNPGLAPPPYAAKTGAVPQPPPYYQYATLPPPQANLQGPHMPPPSSASVVTSSTPQPAATTTTTTTVENVTAAAAGVAP
ncbi:uncharacterized protein [Littorina saxatilis]|uniref:Uncharacterized protein n=1 Tax=Littorina saxatilis TaxID=31220 RepID=A0AAN9C1J0_9CAEN